MFNDSIYGNPMYDGVSAPSTVIPTFTDFNPSYAGNPYMEQQSPVVDPVQIAAQRQAIEDQAYQDELAARAAQLNMRSQYSAQPIQQQESLSSYPEDYQTYTIRRGDSLSKIARDHGMSPTEWRKLAEINGITNPDLIRAGQTISIPSNWKRLVSEAPIKPRVSSTAKSQGTTTNRSTASTKKTQTPVRNTRTYSEGNITSKTYTLPEVSVKPKTSDIKARADYNRNKTKEALSRNRYPNSKGTSLSEQARERARQARLREENQRMKRAKAVRAQQKKAQDRADRAQAVGERMGYAVPQYQFPFNYRGSRRQLANGLIY